MKTFIEIGTSDFDTLLPLAKQGWKGIFIEPVSYLLDNIERVEGCIYLNAAISNYNGVGEIEYVAEPQDEWERGANALIGERVFYLYDVRETEVEKTEVMRLDDLLDKYYIKQIDFLKIDTEGSEWKILEDYSFKIKPSIIKCEHKHWDVWQKQGPSGGLLISKLESLGYLVYVERDDFYAII